jgi:hypothetical protein
VGAAREKIGGVEWQCRESKTNQGCQIFLAKITNTGKNLPNYHKMYQMSIKYIKWP